jgi:hypothetical protein
MGFIILGEIFTLLKKKLRGLEGFSEEFPTILAVSQDTD